MNIDYCLRCGKLYAKNPLGVCPACVKELEEMYHKCVEYLRQNRGATIWELSEQTGVPQKQIIKFIRDGRISIVNYENISYPCEVCGTAIREGNICDSCRSKLSNDVKRLSEKMRQEENSRSQHQSTYKIHNDQ